MKELYTYSYSYKINHRLQPLLLLPLLLLLLLLLPLQPCILLLHHLQGLHLLLFLPDLPLRLVSLLLLRLSSLFLLRLSSLFLLCLPYSFLLSSAFLLFSSSCQSSASLLSSASFLSSGSAPLDLRSRPCYHRSLLRLLRLHVRFFFVKFFLPYLTAIFFSLSFFCHELAFFLDFLRS